MRNRPAVVLLLLPLIPALACAADPALLRFAPPDSGVIVGLNLEHILASDLGRSMLSQAKLDSPEVKKFIASVGFDPLRDIREVLIAAPAKNQKGRGLFLLRGTFDPTKFAELAVQPGMTAAVYRGVQIMTKNQQEQPLSMACLDASMILGGDPESVRSAITRRDQGPGPDAALAAKAAAMSEQNDIWFVSHVSPADLTGDAPDGGPAGAPQMELLRSIEQASGGLKLGKDLVLAADVTTHTPKDAESIAAMLRLFIGLAASNKRDAKQAAAILEKLVLRAEGNSVKISFSIPEAELEKSIHQAMEQASQNAVAALAGRPVIAPPPPEPTGVTIYSSPRDMGVVKLPPQNVVTLPSP
jgi:hypothetical protein